MKTFILSFISCLVFLSCEKAPKDLVLEVTESLAEETENYSPAEKFDSITIIYTDSAQIKLRMFGQKLYRYEEYFNQEKNVTRLEEGLKLEIYENGQPNTTLIAQEGTIFEGKDVIEFKKDVYYNSGDGLELKTDFLIWDKAKSTIHVPIEEKVQVKDRKKGNIINGYGLESNGNFTKYTVTKVNGIIQIEDKSGNSTSPQTSESEENTEKTENLDIEQ